MTKTQLILAGIIVSFIFSCKENAEVKFISAQEQDYIIETATSFMDSLPVTVTANICDRSAGGPNDFYSEGDYWWPDSENSEGPYIRRDGKTNPENFVAHRLAMIRLSQIVGMQTSAFLLTGDAQFVESTRKHLEAWFINPETRMNPSLLYVQAIKGRVTGRGIGIIDAIHLVEVARSIEILEKNKAISENSLKEIKSWFSEFVSWLTTHPYGIDEMNTKNNHAACWVMQVGAFASLTGNKEVLSICRERFKTVLLPKQMGEDGSFPLELARTKPYGYSLFNLDAFMTCAEILSDANNNLYEFSTPKGLSLKRGAAYLFPYVNNKSSWPYEPDVMYWDEWPVRHPFLLFAGKAYDNQEYISTWQSLDGYTTSGEVLRNLPIRSPLIWQYDKPVKQ